MRGQGSGEYLALLGAGAVVAIIVVSGILSLTTQVLPSQFEVAQQQCAHFSNADCNQQQFEIENQNYACEWQNNQCNATILPTQTCPNNIQEGNEVCDETDLNGKNCSNFPPYTTGTVQCNTTCTGFDFTNCRRAEPTLCGNGRLETREQCDDNNQINQDGCTNDCTIETGWTCTGEPSLCIRNPMCGETDGNCPTNCTNPPDLDCTTEQPRCGDGIIEGIEACDDNNIGNGDGCSSTCGIEHGWRCNEEPSNCATICGDHLIRGSELCDGINLNNETCQSRGYPLGGTLTCNAICTGFETEQCETHASLAPPNFKIVFSNGTIIESSFTASSSSPYAYSNTLIEATVTLQGQDQWKLNIQNKSDSTITAVWFPLETEEYRLNANLADDYVYYPQLTGVAYKASTVAEGEWKKGNSFSRENSVPCYPGECFSPFVLIADTTNAKILAAENWPPKPVNPAWSKNKLALEFPVQIAANQQDSFTVLIKQVSGNPNTGIHAWQLALDPYKEWLKNNMQQAGLYPLSLYYPDWMKKANGWLHASVDARENFDASGTQFDIIKIQERWNRWKNNFPWIQIWGQMKQPPGDGCCLLSRTIAPTYQPFLTNFANQVKQEGKHISFYQRPWRDEDGTANGSFFQYGGGEYIPLDDESIRFPTAEGTNETALDFYRGWIERNEQAGENAYYLDVTGATYLGKPLFVANQFQKSGQTNTGIFRPGSVIEWPVDVYPAAFLLGGGLVSNQWVHGGPGIFPGVTLQNSGYSPAIFNQYQLDANSTFPRLGRYVLDDRIFFSGASNGDDIFWGGCQYIVHETQWNGEQWGYYRNLGCRYDAPKFYDYCGRYLEHPNACEQCRRCEYWTERQTFLLGAKFDAKEIADSEENPQVMNKVLEKVIQLWTEHRWWDRNLEYRDTAGISNVPSGVEVRRFVELNAQKQVTKNIFVIDNWEKQLNGQVFFFNGNLILIPADSLSIIEQATSLPR